MIIPIKGKDLNIPCENCGELLKKGYCKRCKEDPINREDLNSAKNKLERSETEFTNGETIALAKETMRLLHKIRLYEKRENRINE